MTQLYGDHLWVCLHVSEDWCCVLGYDTILGKHSMSRVSVIFKVVEDRNSLVTQATTLVITCLRTPNLVFQTTHMQHMVLCTGLSGVPDICSMFQTCGCSANVPIPSDKSTSAGPAS